MFGIRQRFEADAMRRTPSDEPAWPRTAYMEGPGDRLTAVNSLPVTIFAHYEGMRLQIKFLPYEAPYEEVIRRCELALGGIRLPPGVWLQCRGCQRRLSLCNNPQRRMPGSCHPERVWEWDINVPFMAFVSLHPDGVTDAVPLRVPSKNETMGELARVATRTLGLDCEPGMLSLNGRVLSDRSTVTQCGIAEGERLVLVQRWRLTVLKGQDRLTVREIDCTMYGHMSLKLLIGHLLENEMFDSIIEVHKGQECLWREGEDDTKSIMEFGVKDGDVLRMTQKSEHEARRESEITNEILNLLRSCQLVSSSAQTEDGEEEEEEEEELDIDDCH